jgi:hypothetical protein
MVYNAFPTVSLYRLHDKIITKSVVVSFYISNCPFSINQNTASRTASSEV